MRLTQVRATDFMGYEDLDLDLSGVDSAVMVGENGSGKSSILDAITWALYDHVGRPDIDSGDALIRDGADEMTVQVDFTAGGRAVSVIRSKQRGRTGTLGLYVDGDSRTLHTIAETRDAVARLVGLTYEALMAGPVMAQETSSAFMRARPAQRKDLLAALFGLDRYERLHEAAKEQRNEAALRRRTAAAAMEPLDEAIGREGDVAERLERAQGALAVRMEGQALAADRVTAAKVALAEATARAEGGEHWFAEVARIAADMNAAKRRIETATDRIQSATHALAQPIIPPPMAPTPEEVAAAEQRFEAATAMAAKVTVAVAKEASLRATIDRMVEARGRVAGVPCGGEGKFAACQFLQSVPTETQLAEVTAEEAVLQSFIQSPAAAGTDTDLAEARTALGRIRAEVATAQHSAAEALDGMARRTEAQRTLEAANEDLKAAGDMLAGLTSAHDRASAQVTAAREAKMAVDRLAEELNGAQQSYDIIRASIATFERDHAAALAEAAVIENAKTSRADWQARFVDADRDTTTYGLLADAFHRDGIPSAILARGIPLIEAEANAILARLPGDLTLALRTQREKKTGGIADTLDVVVTVSGWERQYGLLSVGQRFRVDLALRLGLARVLTHRTGATIDTLWLDEPLAALDAPGREAVMETLGALAGDFGLIVVVSHHPDFNDRFGARVDVSQTDGISTATLA